jgi:peroxiredoxin
MRQLPCIYTTISLYDYVRDNIIDINTKPDIPAANFTLHSAPDQSIALSQFRGHPTILAFYPADFSPVCGDQMTLYNEILPEFQRFNAELVGVSVDGVWSHLAFSKDRNLHFPLLSDFEPKGEVAKKYGV